MTARPSGEVPRAGPRRGSTAALSVLSVLLLTACGTRPTPLSSPPPVTAPPIVASTTASPARSVSATAIAARSAPATSAPGSTRHARWRPRPGDTWQWQLTTPVDMSVDADIYDIDGFNNGPAVVEQLHRHGRTVICYIEVGAAEDFRPDFGRWPSDVLGKPNGWPGERWVDIRRPQRLARVLGPRFDMCRDKGFDAIEPDVMDAHENDTGFPITAEHQLAFNRYVARLAHDRGLSVGLKNDVEQVPHLVDAFDFAVNEECFAQRECASLRPFIAAGKAVLHAEYDVNPATFCAETKALGLSSVRKRWSLDAYRESCR